MKWWVKSKKDVEEEIIIFVVYLLRTTCSLYQNRMHHYHLIYKHINERKLFKSCELTLRKFNISRANQKLHLALKNNHYKNNTGWISFTISKQRSKDKENDILVIMMMMIMTTKSQGKMSTFCFRRVFYTKKTTRQKRERCIMEAIKGIASSCLSILCIMLLRLAFIMSRNNHHNIMKK